MDTIEREELEKVLDKVINTYTGFADVLKEGYDFEYFWDKRDEIIKLKNGYEFAAIIERFHERGMSFKGKEIEIYPYVRSYMETLGEECILEYIKTAKYPDDIVMPYFGCGDILRKGELVEILCATPDLEHVIGEFSRDSYRDFIPLAIEEVYAKPVGERGKLDIWTPLDLLEKCGKYLKGLQISNILMRVLEQTGKSPKDGLLRSRFYTMLDKTELLRDSQRDELLDARVIIKLLEQGLYCHPDTFRIVEKFVKFPRDREYLLASVRYAVDDKYFIPYFCRFNPKGVEDLMVKSLMMYAWIQVECNMPSRTCPYSMGLSVGGELLRNAEKHLATEKGLFSVKSIEECFNACKMAIDIERALYSQTRFRGTTAVEIIETIPVEQREEILIERLYSTGKADRKGVYTLENLDYVLIQSIPYESLEGIIKHMPRKYSVGEFEEYMFRYVLGEKRRILDICSEEYIECFRQYRNYRVHQKDVIWLQANRKDIVDKLEEIAKKPKDRIE